MLSAPLIPTKTQGRLYQSISLSESENQRNETFSCKSFLRYKQWDETLHIQISFTKTTQLPY